ncbi:MAG: hypothetical protein EYC70_09150 [Planctomycetota bacterium]|nr:MAG: hypothetical protein EYC70_09150 [Planctomycetota bacterium]
MAMMALATSGTTQDIIAVDYTGSLLPIDSATGHMFFLDDPGPNTMNSLAKNSRGELFTVITILGQPSVVYQIDPYRAMTSPVVQIPLGSVRALAFGAGDLLYALNDPLGTAGDGVDDLYTIDLTTGTAQYIGTPGLVGLYSLAYWNGVLYSYDEGGQPTSGEGLITIDPATGLGTDVNPAIPGVDGAVGTLCFSDLGVLYAGGGAFGILDTTTGAHTMVSFLPVPVNGMEFLDPISNPLRLSVTGQCPGVLAAAVDGASPRDVIAWLYSVGSSGPFTIPSDPCAGTLLDLGANVRLGTQTLAGEFGNARAVGFTAPAAVCGQLRIQALNLTTCETSNVVFVE